MNRLKRIRQLQLELDREIRSFLKAQGWSERDGGWYFVAYVPGMTVSRDKALEIEVDALRRAAEAESQL